MALVNYHTCDKCGREMKGGAFRRYTFGILSNQVVELCHHCNSLFSAWLKDKPIERD